MTETEKLIADYYAAFNRGDVEGMLAQLADTVAHDVNESGREGGKAAFGAFMARMNRCYREHLTDIVVLVSENGGRAAAEFVVNGTYLETDAGLPEAKGQTYRLPGGAFFTIEGGKITRVTNYYNLQEWLRQVQA